MHPSRFMKGDHMRLQNLYQIYDLKAEKVSGPIMPATKDAVALRTFHELLDNKDTTPGQHPGDFQLLYLGYQDEETGIIDPVKTLTVVASGREWATQRAELADSEQRNARHSDIRPQVHPQ